MPIRVLELRSVRGTGGGPEKTILLGAERTDPNEFAVTVCYLRDARDTRFAVGDRARRLSIDYVEVVERHSFDPGVWSDLRALVRERQIDIVHSHEYKTDFLALLLSKAENVIPLATVHGWTGHTRRDRFVYYPADKRLLRAFPFIIAVSGEIQSELIRKGVDPDRVRVVLNGIDHRAFRRDRSREQAARRQLGLSRHDIVIGSIGRLEPQKRFDLLIQACGAIQARKPNVRLLIAGDGSLREELRALAARVMPGDRCQFLGHRDDVVMLHHAFDLFVQSSRYEGTPNAVLEAMALETPVVATDAGGTIEIAAQGEHALIVPSGDVTALIRAIDQTLASRTPTEARVAAARRRVETALSFETRMTTVENIYRDLVHNYSGREKRRAVA